MWDWFKGKKPIKVELIDTSVRDKSVKSFGEQQDRLSDKLRKICDSTKLDNIILSPVNELTIVFVYYRTIEELCNNLNTNTSVNTITATNIYGYFRHTRGFESLFYRISQTLKEMKLTDKALHDLTQITDAILPLIKQD